MACEEAATNWGNIATWSLVLLGWFAVHQATLSRERRKENRDAVNRLIDEIKSIQSVAVTFHTSEKFDSQASDLLIWRVNRVNRTLQRHPLQSLEIPLGLMVRFRKELTLLNTDASTFVPQPYHSDIVKNSRCVTDEMLEKIEAARDSVFA